jgi:hypothetical protein
MKFAAGLTVSGIVGFLVLEVLKFLMPALAAAIMGFLAIAMKVILIGFVLMIVAGGLGLAYFLYKRAQSSQEVEA